MNAAEHRAEAEAFLRLNGSRAERELNIACAHVHALLALSAPKYVETAEDRAKLGAWHRAQAEEHCAEIREALSKQNL